MNLEMVKIEEITIIIPVYNCEKYIEKCLKSAIEQTYNKIKIVIINDGSTDKTIYIIKKLMSISNRDIKLYCTQNQGIAKTRNLGISLCDTNYFMFVDADDYLEKQAVEKLYNRLVKENCDMVIGSIDDFLENEKAPKHFWLLYYPVEKYLMKYTKKLMVMNNEDYDFAKKHFKNVEIQKVNGIGLNTERLDKEISKSEKEKIFKEFDLKKSDFIISYIAELSKRKDQISLIKQLAKNNIRSTNIKILLIGDDSLNGRIEKLLKKYKLSSNIITTGFRKDINIFLSISDLVLSISKQEGLPLNVMEAIYMKKYIIATPCRGNVDLIKDNINGFIINDVSELWDKIIDFKEHNVEYKRRYNQYIDINKYKVENVLEDVIKNM